MFTYQTYAMVNFSPISLSRLDLDLVTGVILPAHCRDEGSWTAW